MSLFSQKVMRLTSRHRRERRHFFLLTTSTAHPTPHNLARQSLVYRDVLGKKTHSVIFFPSPIETLQRPMSAGWQQVY